MNRRNRRRQQQPKRKPPTLAELQAEAVRESIEDVLKRWHGIARVLPRRVADRAGVSVACVHRVVDDGELAGHWSVRHHADGLLEIHDRRRGRARDHMLREQRVTPRQSQGSTRVTKSSAVSASSPASQSPRKARNEA